MKRVSLFWIRALLMAAVCGLAACFDGSETGNPVKGTAGVLETVNGQPAAHARVYLLPNDFNPLDLVSKHASLLADTTDADGRFQFTGIDSGVYNLEALDLASGARTLVKGITIGKGMVELPDQRLQYPGSIAAAIQGVVDTVHGYIYVTGTTLFKKITASNGIVSLDSVPVGKIDSVQYGNSTDSIAPVAFAWDLAVDSGSATSATAAYLGWSRERSILLNTTPSGAGITGKVSHFPLLVRLSSADFDFSATRSDGGDLRFTNNAGRPLPCEIEHWDSAAGIAEAWVLVDTVFGDSMQTIHMFWGQADSANAFPTGSVFTLADGYAGVWHLDESPNAAAPQFQDASGRKNPGTALGYATQTAAAPGLVEGGMSLDGNTQFAGTEQSFNNPQVFTLSAWFRTSTTGGGKILDFTDSDTSTTTNYRDRHIFMTVNGTVHFSVYPPVATNQADPNPGIYKTVDSPNPLNDNAWHQVVARLSSNGQDLFVDGVLVASDPASTVAENITGYWRWGYGTLTGWASPGTSFYFQGTLDEIWVALSARSDDFIKLTFENQKANSPLLQFP